jgi:hypothetical protein
MVDDDDGGTDPTVESHGTLKGLVANRAPVAISEEMAATVAAASMETDSPPTVPASNQSQRQVLTSSGSTRYELGALLGQGGMGEVLSARDRQIGREVAVKRIRAADPSAEQLARFVREALLQGRLEHPAVVPVHDLAVDAEGHPFFVMKRLTGVVMSEILKTAAVDDHAKRRRLLRAFAEVCLAIEFAHAKGIVHRDLKPANIMLGDFGEVYVLDWGIARMIIDDAEVVRPSQRGLELTTGETSAGTVLGTPAYMAPEQLVGEAVGPAADIYALGCILFEIVAGVPLHRTRRTHASITEPLDARPSQVRETAPELDALCEHATATDLTKRIGSARALGDAVQAYLDGDRDLAVRRELAARHIEEAHRALATDDEASRRAAMRAAGRALALDPTAPEAAALVTQLMLRPPKEAPAEVEDTVAKQDTEMARIQGRLSAISMLGYLGFVPLLLWTGVRDASIVLAFVGVVIASGLQMLTLIRRDRLTSAPIYLNACINAVLIGLICRIVGPFIVAPTLATTTLMAYAAHPAVRTDQYRRCDPGCRHRRAVGARARERDRADLSIRRRRDRPALSGDRISRDTGAVRARAVVGRAVRCRRRVVAHDGRTAAREQPAGRAPVLASAAVGRLENRQSARSRP